MKNLDCRNMACPLPVVTVKRALEEPGTAGVTVQLDSGPPVENVTRFARNRGYTVTESESDNGVTLVITGQGRDGEALPLPETSARRSLLVTSDRLGDGPEELGRLLMKNFLITLLESPGLPDRILFVNRAVLLAVEGSELLEALEKLEQRGVELLSCGVCLDYFHQKEALRLGKVTTMYTIVEAVMTGAGTARL